MTDSHPDPRVLFVVEDDPSAAELIQIYFEEFGYVVRRASSAESARELAMERTPDALVTDLFLDGPESGLAVAAWFRARYPDLAILVTSGLPEDQIREAAAAIPGARIVPKPVRLSQLRAAVEELTESSGATEPTE